MAIVRPFKALRPRLDLVGRVASLPYDVMDRKEAKLMAKGNPYSFLHIVRLTQRSQKPRENTSRLTHQSLKPKCIVI